MQSMLISLTHGEAHNQMNLQDHVKSLKAKATAGAATSLELKKIEADYAKCAYTKVTL